MRPAVAWPLPNKYRTSNHLITINVHVMCGREHVVWASVCGVGECVCVGVSM